MGEVYLGELGYQIRPWGGTSEETRGGGGGLGFQLALQQNVLRRAGRPRIARLGRSRPEEMPASVTWCREMGVHGLAGSPGYL